MSSKPKKGSKGQPATPAASTEPPQPTSEMPRGSMEGSAPPKETPGGVTPGGMTPAGAMAPEGTTSGSVPVLVELRVPAGQSMAALRIAQTVVPSLRLDPGYEPVPVAPSPHHAARMGAGEEVVVVRGTIEENKIDELRARPEVVGVWKDAKIEPFSVGLEARPAPRPVEGAPPKGHVLNLSPAMAPCPFGTCDCSPGTPQGTINDVANYLGVNQIWSAGHRGDGMVVAVVDGGITAVGRTPKTGETAKIPRVIGGYPSDWGTTAAAWGDHGNMCATDVLGMAPNAQIYDIRISAGTTVGTISEALAGYNWAINQHARTGRRR